MKRLAILLALSLSVGLVACESKDQVTTEVDIHSMSTDEALVHLFSQYDPNLSMESFIDIVNTTGSMPFDLTYMEVSEGILEGFGNTEISGFTKGIRFGPMIGSIPFIGYILETESPEELESILKTNADLRWLICDEADKTSTSVNGNKILFIMTKDNYSE